MAIYTYIYQIRLENRMYIYICIPDRIGWRWYNVNDTIHLSLCVLSCGFTLQKCFNICLIFGFMFLCLFVYYVYLLILIRFIKCLIFISSVLSYILEYPFFLIIISQINQDLLKF